MSDLHADHALGEILANSRRNGFGVYLGSARGGPLYAPAQLGALILGPPRSGKTASIIVPNVLSCVGPAVSVSTKRDVLDATVHARLARGDCFLFDPSASIAAPSGVKLVAWSPLSASIVWDRAVLTAESMVGAAAPRGRQGESSHWYERASALLACAFHAGALARSPMSDVIGALHRREAAQFLQVLAKCEARLALDVLTGITETDQREQSGIWSTASGVLGAYRTQSALDSAKGEQFDATRFVQSGATLYIATSSEFQHHVAPLVAGILRDIRSAAFTHFATPASPMSAPVTLVLDELANIAPLHDLPSLVAEGASQGVLTIASLQDLSQARERYGPMADGFLSLFGAKVLLAGIGDVRTLDQLSQLAGDHDVVFRSESRPPRRFGQRGSRTVTTSSRTMRRLPASDLSRPPNGLATAVIGTRFAHIALTPYFAHSPWREVTAQMSNMRSAPTSTFPGAPGVVLQREANSRARSR